LSFFNSSSSFGSWAKPGGETTRTITANASSFFMGTLRNHLGRERGTPLPDCAERVGPVNERAAAADGRGRCPAARTEPTSGFTCLEILLASRGGEYDSGGRMPFLFK